MGRKIIAVIAGYIAMALFVFISFTVLYLILGTEGSFEPGSYRVSVIWLVLSIILSIAGAVLGGYLCSLIAGDKKTAYYLAAIVLVLGLVFAVPSLGDYNEAAGLIRDGSLTNMEAMQYAKQPDAILLLNPLIGAIGILLGAGLRKVKNTSEVKTA